MRMSPHYYLRYAYMDQHTLQALQSDTLRHKSGQQIKVVITFKPRKVRDCMAGSNGSLLNGEWQHRQCEKKDMHLNEIRRSTLNKSGNGSMMATYPQRVIV
ncbi:hypothetical protein ILYODFUR_028287 [Ilyodon furcidens]|uniref:Uncharacterized protein n=1 Tax=Ilyodon furcidens TaxID=33524 RepID=A0ABV0TRI8_9TELE